MNCTKRLVAGLLLFQGACTYPNFRLIDRDAGSDAGDVADVMAAPRVRLLEPMSGATVASGRPTLRWEDADGASTSRTVWLCSNIWCTGAVTELQGQGSVQLPTALAAGRYFWRLASGSTALTPTWSFWVGFNAPETSTRRASSVSTGFIGAEGILVGFREASGQCGNGLFLFFGASSRSFYGPAEDGWGDAVAPVGDVDGDGADDFVLGAPLGLAGAGYVEPYFGSAPGPDSVPRQGARLQLGGVRQLGRAIHAAGDVNQDGYADFLVLSGDQGSGGAVHTFLGGPNGQLVEAPNRRVMDSSVVLDSVLGNLDFNGDQYPDMLYAIRDENNRILVRAMSGGRLGWGTFDDLGPFDSTGRMASLDDIDGDGLDDFAIASIDPATTQGKVRVFHGSTVVGQLREGVTVQRGLPGDRFGTDFVAGDLDADGRSDLWVGAPGVGLAYLVLGQAGGTFAVPTSGDLQAQPGLGAEVGFGVRYLVGDPGRTVGTVQIAAPATNSWYACFCASGRIGQCGPSAPGIPDSQLSGRVLVP